MIIQTNIDLHKYSTFGLRAKAKYIATITKESEFSELSDFIADVDAPILSLGGGSNVLFCADYPGVIVKNDLKGITRQSNGLIRCGAGTKLDDIVSFSITNQLYGLEPLSFIPGTIGGAIALNAGAYGTTISQWLDTLRVYDVESREFITLSRKDLTYWHRSSILRKQRGSKWIIVDVLLGLAELPVTSNHPKVPSDLHGQSLREEIKILRSHLPDPAQIQNAGSFFLNPIVTDQRANKILKDHPGCAMRKYDSKHFQLASGWLIEKAGLKGKVIDDFLISNSHANIVINQNPRATGQDVKRFAEKVNTYISEMFGIYIEPEPLLIGAIL